MNIKDNDEDGYDGGGEYGGGEYGGVSDL